MRDITIKITPRVIDYRGMPNCKDRIGFPTEIDYGSLEERPTYKVMGVHRVDELEAKFTEIIKLLNKELLREENKDE